MDIKQTLRNLAWFFGALFASLGFSSLLLLNWLGVEIRRPEYLFGLMVVGTVMVAWAERRQRRSVEWQIARAARRAVRQGRQAKPRLVWSRPDDAA